MDAATGIAELVKQWGAYGVVLGGLALAFWRQSNQLNDVQELRAAEAKEMTRAVVANTGAIEALTSYIKEGRHK